MFKIIVNSLQVTMIAAIFFVNINVPRIKAKPYYCLIIGLIFTLVLIESIKFKEVYLRFGVKQSDDPKTYRIAIAFLSFFSITMIVSSLIMLVLQWSR